jgi:aquaporin Z
MTVVAAPTASHDALSSLRASWRIYAMDGALLGLFMISACTFAALLEHPSSPVRQAIESPLARRAMGGCAMALTAICLTYSPWGRRSGPLMNPAMTIGFLRLNRIGAWDAIYFMAGQFIGATLGVALMWLIVRMLVGHPAVNYAATLPGKSVVTAWIGEFCIAFVMMSMVMAANKQPKLAPFTGCIAAALVATYITIEAPLSGMSLNPARTFGSAVFAHTLSTFWLYFTAPVLGMLAGIELHRALTTEHQKLCGKLTHSRTIACFMQCDCLERKDSAR